MTKICVYPNFSSKTPSAIEITFFRELLQVCGFVVESYDPDELEFVMGADTDAEALLSLADWANMVVFPDSLDAEFGVSRGLPANHFQQIVESVLN